VRDTADKTEGESVQDLIDLPGDAMRGARRHNA
jgi:hypothetical protein